MTVGAALPIYRFIATQTSYDFVVPAVVSDQSEFNRRVRDAFTGLVGGVKRCGDMVERPTAASIAGYLLCDGSEIERDGFPELFAYLGTLAGAGDGTTTFNLPNYVGTAPVAATAPPQVVDPGGTVSTGGDVEQPTQPGQTGGTTGGNITTGARRNVGLPDD